AMRRKVRLMVRSSFSDEPGTLVCDEEEIMESTVVSGVAYSRDEAKVTVASVEDRPGVAAAIFGPLAAQGINVDMIVQNVSEDGRTDMTFSCPVEDVEKAEAALSAAASRDELAYRELIADREVAKVSIVGIGMRSHAGVAQKMFRALAEEGVNIRVITTSEIKVSVLV
ncbi:MAG: ACT domain-containing protein, partial [Pseudomonadota bacterium]